MDDLTKLINLPWASLLTLASGYAGYFVANVGIREHHKTIDVVFSSLVFGFFGAFAYNASQRLLGLTLSWASLIAFIFALVLGGCWSLFGRNVFEKILRTLRISYADELPSAWMALFSKKRVATQLSVKLKDGTWLKCDDLSRFTSSPNGPCVLGAKGDVLMYITHVQSSVSEVFFARDSLADAYWGDEVTYIPADQIARIDFRRRRT
ncbi:hypothetical protein [Bradyrhizobium sp. F1.13.3]|uniref:DUF6338 family protein n=1 Tax=Bradyrhizobium sp. F1.13.3 TaxID=3156351 RepID=UPI003393C943